jgi:hypothetical protein
MAQETSADVSWAILVHAFVLFCRPFVIVVFHCRFLLLFSVVVIIPVVDLVSKKESNRKESTYLWLKRRLTTSLGPFSFVHDGCGCGDS